MKWYIVKIESLDWCGIYDYFAVQAENEEDAEDRVYNAKAEEMFYEHYTQDEDDADYIEDYCFACTGELAGPGDLDIYEKL